jgi:hypothetical protein
VQLEKNDKLVIYISSINKSVVGKELANTNISSRTKTFIMVLEKKKQLEAIKKP